MAASLFTRCAIVPVVSISLLASTTRWKPFNDAPSPPAVRSQIDGSSRGLAPMLQVAVHDPDGDAMDVTFFGRQIDGSGASAHENVTLVVVPDPQKYAATAALSATYRAQMRWIVASRRQLGTAFVVSVGDLVQDDRSAIQWSRADAAWDIVDEADVPYSVVPGNHDMTERGEAPLYDRHFPAARYHHEPWYGGWLGDPTDAIPETEDRGNKDSYQLFSAGAMDFVVVNLEVDLPAAAVAWAQSVIDAYPDRHAILVTHRWMEPDAVRWRSSLFRHDTTLVSPQQAWDRLVAPNCSVSWWSRDTIRERVDASTRTDAGSRSSS